jgi:hypothetical protein
MLMILFLVVDVPEFILKGFKVYRQGPTFLEIFSGIFEGISNSFPIPSSDFSV